MTTVTASAALASVLGEMAAALEEEAGHAQRAAVWIRIRNGRRLRAGLERVLYCFDAEADLWFPPGTTAELAVGLATEPAGSAGSAGGSADSGDEPVVVEVLEVRGQSVWLESPRDLGESIGSARLRSNPWYLLDALRTRIDGLRGEEGQRPAPASLPLLAALLGLSDLPALPGTGEAGVSAAEIAAGYEGLTANDSQLAAVAACLSSALRFVWGPPGTGKTQTLGLLAAESYLRGETVLVVAHSNAAVDAAAVAFVRSLMSVGDARESKATGEALRAGEPFLQEAQSLPVTERAVLGRSRPELVARLETLEGRGGELMDGQDSLFGGAATRQRRAGRELAAVTGELKRVRDQLARAQRDLLSDAQLVLATFSKVAITPDLFERRFDRVLVDEASMAQPPQVVVAASLATRGVAVFGDFRQLAPVVQSWSRPVRQWLGRDAFELNGLVRNVDASPILSVLDVQYRMHPKIMDLVNGPSYRSRLRAGPAVAEATAPLAHHGPAPGEPVVWIDTGEIGGRAFATRTHSRVNPLSAWLALQVALRMIDDGLGDVGVVTPYRDQARLLRLLVRAAGVQDGVHTGTIHRFQGGERDAIVLDLVDGAPLPPGTLFRSDDGLRLLNVAVTRARGKLVCLSDGSYLRRGASSPAWAILANLCRNASPLDPWSVVQSTAADAGWAVLKPSAETAALLGHDLSESAETIAFEAGLPGWAVAALREREGVRRLDAGARAILLSSRTWIFPKQAPWSLRLSDPQAVKLLAECIGAPPAERAAPPRSAPPPKAPVRAPAAGETPAFPLGRCRHCNGPLGLAVGSGAAAVRVSCSSCGTFERDAEPGDLTTCARARDLRCGCGAELRGRRGPRGLFLGCASYPACRATRQATVLVYG